MNLTDGERQRMSEYIQEQVEDYISNLSPEDVFEEEELEEWAENNGWAKKEE